MLFSDDLKGCLIDREIPHISYLGSSNCVEEK